MTYNFRTVMGQSSYKSWKNWEEGDFLEGKYVSQGTDNFDKPQYKVEVVEASFASGGEPKVGSIFAFNSSGALNKAMEEIEVGDIVKVIYEGKGIMQKGKYAGKKFHSMKVQVASPDGTHNKTTKSEESEDLI